MSGEQGSVRKARVHGRITYHQPFWFQHGDRAEGDVAQHVAHPKTDLGGFGVGMRRTARILAASGDEGRQAACSGPPWKPSDREPGDA
jgi:hypothetical protein